MKNAPKREPVCPDFGAFIALAMAIVIQSRKLPNWAEEASDCEVGGASVLAKSASYFSLVSL